jgi:hypothetical protein
MDKILLIINKFYLNEKIKQIYTWILTGVTIILLLIVPVFIKRTNILGSVFFDLLVRVFITYSFYHLFHFVMNLDRYYDKFYAGTIPITLQKPDTLKQIINILAAIFVGSTSGVFYNSIVRFFIPNIGSVSFVISIFIGLSLLFILLSQYQKR